MRGRLLWWWWCGGRTVVSFGVLDQMWREKSARVRSMFEAATLASIDLAESQLLRGIRNGNTACVIFYLKCKGGWSERAQIEITNSAQARPASGEAVAFAKKIVASPEGPELINKLLAIAAGRNPDAPLQ